MENEYFYDSSDVPRRGRPKRNSPEQRHGMKRNLEAYGFGNDVICADSHQEEALVGSNNVYQNLFEPEDSVINSILNKDTRPYMDPRDANEMYHSNDPSSRTPMADVNGWYEADLHKILNLSAPKTEGRSSPNNVMGDQAMKEDQYSPMNADTSRYRTEASLFGNRAVYADHGSASLDMHSVSSPAYAMQDADDYSIRYPGARKTAFEKHTFPQNRVPPRHEYEDTFSVGGGARSRKLEDELFFGGSEQGKPAMSRSAFYNPQRPSRAYSEQNSAPLEMLSHEMFVPQESSRKEEHMGSRYQEPEQKNGSFSTFPRMMYGMATSSEKPYRPVEGQSCLFRQPMEYRSMGLLYGSRKKRRNNNSPWGVVKHDSSVGIPPSKYSSLEYIQGCDTQKGGPPDLQRRQEKGRNNYLLVSIIDSGHCHNEEQRQVLKSYRNDVVRLDLENITVFQLKSLMKEYGLNQTGKKNDLIQYVKETLRKVECMDAEQPMQEMPTDVGLSAPIETPQESERELCYEKFFF